VLASVGFRPEPGFCRAIEKGRKRDHARSALRPSGIPLRHPKSPQISLACFWHRSDECDDGAMLLLDSDEAGKQGTDDCLLRLGRKLWVTAVTQSISIVPAGAVFSFLKQVSGEPWTKIRLMQVLMIKADAASKVTPLLEMMGYAEPIPGKKNVWRNTQSGNTVAGAKPPRFNYDSVVEALAEMRGRVAQMNADRSSPFQVAELIAFGDFLDQRPKVQAADVGVALLPKKQDQAAAPSVMERQRQERVLADLRAKSSILHLHLIEDWMRKCSHRDLLRVR
jgi:hypothetical protein